MKNIAVDIELDVVKYIPNVDRTIHPAFINQSILNTLVSANLEIDYIQFYNGKIYAYTGRDDYWMEFTVKKQQVIPESTEIKTTIDDFPNLLFN